MNTKMIRRLLYISLGLVLLSACGGGGGNGAPQTTTAVITLSAETTGTIPANTVIAGYDVTINLPDGVTVASAAPPAVDDGVVAGTGSGAEVGTSISASFAAAAGSTPAKLHIVLISPKANGIAAGKFCTVTCVIANGHAPSASDFEQPVFTVSGFNTNTSSTVDLTTEMSLTAIAVVF